MHVHQNRGPFCISLQELTCNLKHALSFLSCELLHCAPRMGWALSMPSDDPSIMYAKESGVCCWLIAYPGCKSSPDFGYWALLPKFSNYRLGCRSTRTVSICLSVSACHGPCICRLYWIFLKRSCTAERLAVKVVSYRHRSGWGIALTCLALDNTPNLISCAGYLSNRILAVYGKILDEADTGYQRPTLPWSRNLQASNPLLSSWNPGTHDYTSLCSSAKQISSWSRQCRQEAWRTISQQLASPKTSLHLRISIMSRLRRYDRVHIVMILQTGTASQQVNFWLNSFFN